MAVAVLLACGLAGQGKVGFTLRRAACPAPLPAYSAVFTPDSRYIVTGSFDATLLLDVEAHKLVNRFPADNDGAYASAGANEFKLFAVSSDGKYVASGGGGWRPVQGPRLLNGAALALVQHEPDQRPTWSFPRRKMARGGDGLSPRRRCQAVRGRLRDLDVGHRKRCAATAISRSRSCPASRRIHRERRTDRLG